MLSLVSCVCLGMCPGMWIVSIGIYLGVQVWSFISVLLLQRSDCLKWAAPLGCVCFVLVKLRFRWEWMILKPAIYTCHEHPCVFRIGVSYPPPTHPPTHLPGQIWCGCSGAHTFSTCVSTIAMKLNRVWKGIAMIWDQGILQGWIRENVDRISLPTPF